MNDRQRAAGDGGATQNPAYGPFDRVPLASCAGGARFFCRLLKEPSRRVSRAEKTGFFKTACVQKRN